MQKNEIDSQESNEPETGTRLQPNFLKWRAVLNIC